MSNPFSISTYIFAYKNLPEGDLTTASVLMHMRGKRHAAFNHRPNCSRLCSDLVKMGLLEIRGKSHFGKNNLGRKTIIYRRIPEDKIDERYQKVLSMVRLCRNFKDAAAVVRKARQNIV